MVRDNPKVNILIASYNYGQYIDGCIDSCLNQTYNNTNITIVDGGSQDNSINIITNKLFSNARNILEYDVQTSIGSQDYKTRILGNSDYHVKKWITKLGQVRTLITTVTNGPSQSRNIGIAETLDTSDYYQILDADDEMYEDKISTLISEILKHPSIGVCYADYDILTVETGTILSEFKKPFVYENLLRECIVHSGSLVKREALLSVADQFGIYDREMRTAEDYDLWLRIAKGWMISHVAKKLTLVRNHQNNSTYAVDKSVWQQNWSRIYQKHMMK